MNVLDAGDELVGKQQNGFQGELSVAEIEKIFQAGAEKVENHGVVITFSAKPAHKWNTDATSERLVNTSFILQLGVLGFDRLQLDGNFLSRNDVGAQINVTERTGTDLSADAVLVADTKILQNNE